MKEIPEEVMAATFNLIESCSIEIDDSIDEKIEPSMLSIINDHNLELGSVIQTASVDALVELLIEKGIISNEEYQNNFLLKLIENKDIIENLALRANDLKNDMMCNNTDDLNDNNTCTTGD